MSKLGIYSGKCFLGECGKQTELTDYKGEPLYVGDIILLSYNHYNGGVTETGSLTAIVEDEDGAFTMGIKCAKKHELAIENEDGELMTGWVIDRVKSFKDVVDGEHWSDYGFNYAKIKDEVLNER